jgi:hypothetical protein
VDRRGDPEAGDGPIETAAEALRRARRHGRAAAAEALAALHALLDATALATTGRPSEFHELLSPLAKLLEGLAEPLGREGEPVATPILAAVAEALEVEIRRWEERAGEDPEARAVLRAFLGLREVLWEFGVRRDSARRRHDGGRPAAEPRARPGEARAPRPRVQRVPIEG